MKFERSIVGRPLWRSLLGLIVVFGGVAARADTEHEVLRGVGACGSRLIGLSEGDRVSGTKVEFGITFWHNPAKYYPGGKPEPDWAHMRVKDLTFELGPAPEPFLIESRSGTVNQVSFSYRFASTAFAHNSAVPIRVRATLELGYIQAPPNFLVVHSVPYDHTFSVTAYNQAQFAGLTTESLRSGSAHYHVPSTFMANVSNQLLGHAFAFATATKHEKVPTTPGNALTLQRQAIVNAIAPATAAVWNLHGYQAVGNPARDIVADSDGWTLNDWLNQVAVNHAVQPSEVQAAVASKGTNTPPYNLAVLYSCHTVDGSNQAQPTSQFASAFGIAANGECRAYLGFSQSLNASCWTPDLWARVKAENCGNPFLLSGGPEFFNAWVYQQAEVLFASLSEGATLQKAAGDAQASFPGVYFDPTSNPDFTTWPWYRVGPTTMGDPLHRSRYVYLSGAERSLLGQNTDVEFVRLPVTGGA